MHPFHRQAQCFVLMVMHELLCQEARAVGNHFETIRHTNYRNGHFSEIQRLRDTGGVFSFSRYMLDIVEVARTSPDNTEHFTKAFKDLLDFVDCLNGFEKVAPELAQSLREIGWSEWSEAFAEPEMARPLVEYFLSLLERDVRADVTVDSQSLRVAKRLMGFLDTELPEMLTLVMQADWAMRSGARPKVSR